MGKTLMELGRLKVEFAKEYLRVTDMYILDEANEHAIMRLTLISKRMLTVEEILTLQDEPIKVTDSDGDNIFVGICQTIELVNEADYSELILQAKSLSIQTDKKNISRTLQNPDKTLQDVANTVMAAYGIQVAVERNQPIQQLLYQNSETDWQFLRRIANQYGACLYTDSKAGVLRLAIGPYPFASKQLGAETRKKPADSHKDILNYLKIKHNANPEAPLCLFQTEERLSYDLTIGVGYRIENQGERARISQRSEIISQGAVAENRLTLAYPAGCLPDSQASMGARNRSSILKGKVLNIQGTQVKVHFFCDAAQDEATATWIPFENIMNNYLYSMPDVGDEIFVYYENNGKVMALGSRRSNSATHPDFSDPSHKILNSTNNLLKMTPGSCELIAGRSGYDSHSGNQASIVMSDADGIVVSSNQAIHIQADKTLCLAASQNPVSDESLQKLPTTYNSRHNQEVERYKQAKGSQPCGFAENWNKQTGISILESYANAPKGKLEPTPPIVSSIQTRYGGEVIPPVPIFPLQQRDDPSHESLIIKTSKTCSFSVGNSHIIISQGGGILINTPVYRHLGYTQNGSVSQSTPFLESLNKNQVRLDVVGCIPSLDVTEKGTGVYPPQVMNLEARALCAVMGCILPDADHLGKEQI